MPFNGAGVYVLTGADNPAVGGTLILASKQNNNQNDLATALSLCVTRDGQSPATANIPMGGFKHVNVADGTTRASPVAHYATLGQVQDGGMLWAGTAGGTADALTLTLSPVVPAYVAGQAYIFKAGASANTGAATVAVSGLAAKAIQSDGAALVAGAIIANLWYRIVYDGAAFQLEQVGANTFALSNRTVQIISGNTTLTVASIFNRLVVTATATITLPASATMAVGDRIIVKSTTTGEVLIDPPGVDTLDGSTSNYRLPAFCDCEIMKSAAGAFVLVQRPNVNVGDWMWAGYGTANQGWAKSSTGDRNRTTDAGLFAVYGTTWGAGDGSTTFGIPSGAGRSPVQAGTGSVTEQFTGVTAAANAVASADSGKWDTGMLVVVSGTSGFGGTGLSNGTHYVVKTGSNLSFASTLANAQNGTVETLTGTGSALITHTYAAKTLGQYGGKESHAISSTENLAHTHGPGAGTTMANLAAGAVDAGYTGGGGGPYSSLQQGASTTASRGGNVAMPTRDPYFVGELYIKL